MRLRLDDGSALELPDDTELEDVTTLLDSSRVFRPKARKPETVSVSVNFAPIDAAAAEEFWSRVRESARAAVIDAFARGSR